MINLILILALCFGVLFIYFKTKSFKSLSGLVMFAMAFSALFLRFDAVSHFPLLGIFNKETLLQSFLIIIPTTLTFLFFGYYSGHFKKRLKRLERLLFPYILFGALQQIFFLWVFTDSFYYLTGSLNITFIASFLFFISIHLDWKSSIKKYWFLLIVFTFVNVWIYLFWNNILPQALIHGIVGAVLFTEFTDTDQLKSRLA